MTRSRQQAGFTLAEVIVAMAILAIGVAAIVTATRWAAQATDHTTQLTIASQLAQAKIEEFHAPAASVAAGSDSTGRFTRAWSVSSQGNRRNVSVTVRWNGLTDGQHQVGVDSIVYVTP
jgi:prepilin-type N-terminal cleavage/methylation domain-containing protein